MVCLTIFPGLALASSSDSVGRHYDIPVGRHALVSERTIAATALVADPQEGASGWWSRQSVRSVVREGEDSRGQPASRGYICLPAVQMSTTRFTCLLNVAGAVTSVKLTFALRYSQDANSVEQSNTPSPGTFTVDVDVIGQPARATTALIYNAANEPYASPSSDGTTVKATAGMYLEVPRGGLVISALDTPLNAAIHTTLRNVDSRVRSPSRTAPR
ncbi:MAG TPA: hypothetical protein VME22_23765 [Solirubrobacteraceae bacterium]|nr:hypothetical protein [Solirubrobacteraceae bacterium]